MYGEEKVKNSVYDIPTKDYTWYVKIIIITLVYLAKQSASGGP
jgi:hypothetical protein